MSEGRLYPFPHFPTESPEMAHGRVRRLRNYCKDALARLFRSCQHHERDRIVGAGKGYRSKAITRGFQTINSIRTDRTLGDPWAHENPTGSNHPKYPSEAQMKLLTVAVNLLADSMVLATVVWVFMFAAKL